MSDAQAGGAGAGSSGTAPAAALPGLDLAALGNHLHAAGIAIGGPLRGHLLAGGRSNLTYLVTDGTHRWVLRRPPLGHVLATAHNMSREYRILTALAASTVPVPAAVAHYGDPEVIGAPFYLMEYVEGVIYRSGAQLTAVSAADANRLADGLVDALVALHTTDPAAVGLADFGRPDGYLARQLDRWARQLAASRSRTVTGLDGLGSRLAASIPPQGPAVLVHGDYRLDNVIMATGAPGRVLAVLDWEMATLGDPLTDLAAMVMFWDGLGGLDTVITTTPADYPSFPDRSRLLARYADATGASLARLPWYLGFAYYKLAVICEGIHYRHTRGETVGEGFDRIGALVPGLVERGRRTLKD
ncbi:MAG TPA: phosphotransferase family protein [Streptosporangiaceae bacterium]|nr:phosphotransferase family protein [Streptosporangiaceae bacterium]